MIRTYAQWVAANLASGNEVEFYSVGVLSAIYRIERKPWIRKDGSIAHVPAMYRPKWIASKKLKKALIELAKSPKPHYFNGRLNFFDAHPGVDKQAQIADVRKRGVRRRTVRYPTTPIAKTQTKQEVEGGLVGDHVHVQVEREGGNPVGMEKGGTEQKADHSV